jgi:ubiquinone/menaquinone biosynthesis C-methylase UbiE
MSPIKIFHNLIRDLFKLFFHLLYHQFAWTYDWVAALVSIGRWQSWISCVLPYLKSSRVLELGSGPGHLQLALAQKGIIQFGIDASPQMIGLAIARLRKNSFPPNIILGTAQCLPFPDSQFDKVVATFPSEYISDNKTINQAWRVLNTPGELIILPLAWITGEKWWDRLATRLFQITGQTQRLDQGRIEDSVFFPIQVLEAVGFQVSSEIIQLQSSKVIIIRAIKLKAHHH